MILRLICSNRKLFLIHIFLDILQVSYLSTEPLWTLVTSLRTEVDVLLIVFHKGVPVDNTLVLGIIIIIVILLLLLYAFGYAP